MSPSRSRRARFDRTERWLHWANAALFLILLATAAALYLDPVSRTIGRRELMKQVHVYAGLLLPVPFLAAFTVGRTQRLVDDFRRLDRWGADRTFNRGQQVNAAVIVGAVPVMLLTGSIMRWFSPFPLSWRTGATFVHDWVAVVVFVFVAGHIVKATASILGDDPLDERAGVDA